MSVGLEEGEGGKGGLTLLVRVEGREVVCVEGELGDVGLRAGGVPLLGEDEGLGRERGVVLHLDGELEALAVEPRVPLDGVERLHLLRPAVRGPVRVEVRLPLRGGDALAHEGAHVVAHVRQERVEPAERALEVEDEVRALLVRDGAVRVVGVLARVEVDDEALVLGPVDVLLERVLERLLADEEGEAAVGGRVQELEEDALDVRRPAFVEPKVGRVRLSSEIATSE